jgi:TetR/AcrR family transcriptional repressor of uid operon
VPVASARTLQKEETREALFGCAMRLFDERGYDGVSVEDIVRAAGVARGTFYVHFPAKDDVLIELIRRSDATITARMKAAGKKPLRAILRATTAAFADNWRERRALLPHAGAVAMRRIAMVAEARDAQPLRVELVRHVDAALAAGEISAALPAQMLADIFLLDVFAALMAWANSGAPALEIVMEGMIELFLHGAARPVRTTK